jgi:manganese transport protein
VSERIARRRHERLASAESVLPGEAATLRAAQASLDGTRTGVRALWPFLGPAFIAAVAYVDPGNFATGGAAGSKFGYLLVWVVVSANLMAMLVQTLSAKLGVASGLNLAEACRETMPKARYPLWIQAEAVAMATDIAEIVGAALGLHLLFGIPLFPAALIAGGAAFGILELQRRGFRRLEAVIAAMVGVIALSFALNVFFTGPDGGEILRHLVPQFQGTESVLLATGILGATVMPHVVYLHSALTQNRIVGKDERERRAIQRFERIDVVIAMSLAGLVNLSILAIFAASLGGLNVDDIPLAHELLADREGDVVAFLFGLALLTSGLSSSSVGTLAGQVVMQGFIRRQIPIFARRAITLAPALVVVGIGLDPTRALVLSQVVLSFGIPFALVPLIIMTSRGDLMGTLRNTKPVMVAASVVAAIIICLNVFLLIDLAH